MCLRLYLSPEGGFSDMDKPAGISGRRRPVIDHIKPYISYRRNAVGKLQLLSCGRIIGILLAVCSHRQPRWLKGMKIRQLDPAGKAAVRSGIIAAPYLHIFYIAMRIDPVTLPGP